ncbi:molybdopterin molybdotransferase MoeA [Psychrobacter sp. I-STPA10]|uniref:molybdopterin molybdotransferase MoeA n=1 Tax=Psychrobacter sp. I-STPA10 TaxID=2585769 RepID=UPI001E407525|nr:gephyrin-like molybdotransferase Glp [Psychrobacter sp. I-STPA10]
MISLQQLQAAIKERIGSYYNAQFYHQRQKLCVDLLQSMGCILAEDITAPFDVPRQNLSSMDGFALAIGSQLAEGTHIEIVGESQAGQPFDAATNQHIQGQSLHAGQGVRIFTGAVLPAGCDTVVMQEHTNFEQLKQNQQHNLDKSQPYLITLSQAAKSNTNIRQQGDEIKADEVVLSKGKRLNPTDISLLANLGVAQVQIYQPLVVGLLATGDELVELEQPLTSLAQIYNSNTPTLKALLSELPVSIKDYGILKDDLAEIEQCLTTAAQQCDVLISSAGVSVGDYDFLTTAIAKVGKINHYKVAMKPGKPFVFGEMQRSDIKRSAVQRNDTDTPVQNTIFYFGLPGNPLSAVVSCLQLVMPSLWQMSGVKVDDVPMRLTVKATLTTDIKKSTGRLDFQRGILTQLADGTYQVTALTSQQSHRIKQLSNANCLIVLDKDSGNVAAGAVVNVQPFKWCLA